MKDYGFVVKKEEERNISSFLGIEEEILFVEVSDSWNAARFGKMLVNLYYTDGFAKSVELKEELVKKIFTNSYKVGNTAEEYNKVFKKMESK